MNIQSGAQFVICGLISFLGLHPSMMLSPESGLEDHAYRFTRSIGNSFSILSENLEEQSPHSDSSIIPLQVNGLIPFSDLSQPDFGMTSSDGGLSSLENQVLDLAMAVLTTLLAPVNELFLLNEIASLKSPFISDSNFSLPNYPLSSSISSQAPLFNGFGPLNTLAYAQAAERYQQWAHQMAQSGIEHAGEFEEEYEHAAQVDRSIEQYWDFYLMQVYGLDLLGVSLINNAIFFADSLGAKIAPIVGTEFALPADLTQVFVNPTAATIRGGSVGVEEVYNHHGVAIGAIGAKTPYFDGVVFHGHPMVMNSSFVSLEDLAERLRTVPTDGVLYHHLLEEISDKLHHLAPQDYFPDMTNIMDAENLIATLVPEWVPVSDPQLDSSMIDIIHDHDDLVSQLHNIDLE